MAAIAIRQFEDIFPAIRSGVIATLMFEAGADAGFLK
jgi:hypothetical protein